ncbi:PAS domain S-box protein, partial [candidate division WOR-3 bacterium]|nr:PAS domain S-box protein [candidate division WOR-3 bacterium]MBD3364313.1 PAS domain S-box protein [candidate division WOR-3 bacterium]
RIERKNGEIATLEVRVRPIIYGDKEAYLGNCVDITELIEQRRQIVQAKKAWESTFDSISDLVMILDPDNYVMRANRAVKDYTSMSLEELGGKSYLEVYGLEDAVETKIDSSKGTKLPEHFEIRDQTRWRIFSVSVSPLLDPLGQKVATVHVARDITQMRNMEDALFQSEAQFRGLAESAIDIIFSVELDGVISYINPAVKEILGLSSAEFIGIKLDRIKSAGLFTEKVKEQLTKNLSGPGVEKAIPFFEIETEDALGRKHVIEVSARRLPNRIVGIARDVTERNRMQQQLIKASKLASIGVLAAGIAHQVNNPLAILLVHSSLLRTILTEKEEVPDGIKEEVSGYLDTMEEQVERTRRVVSGLLEFTHPERSAPKPSDVNAIVQEGIRWVKQRYSFDEITMNVKLEKSLPEALADKVALEQVVVNVLQNAYDAMEGSGIISVSTENPEGKTIRIRVSDNGPGVPTDIADEIFEPLFTTKSGNKGTGLGLSLSAMLLERFGGQILLDKGCKNGACFVIEVPVYRGEK